VAAKLHQQQKQNLTHILESFKKEKTVFNQKFSELRRRLDSFGQPRAL